MFALGNAENAWQLAQSISTVDYRKLSSLLMSDLSSYHLGTKNQQLAVHYTLCCLHMRQFRTDHTTGSTPNTALDQTANHQRLS